LPGSGRSLRGNGAYSLLASAEPHGFLVSVR
jgi:hypothetical protein